MRIHHLIILHAVCLVSATAFSQTLSETIDESRTTRTLRRAHWGVCAAFVDSDSTVVAYNSEKSLAPASCLKLVTTAAGLSLLGEDYRFRTRVYADGPIDARGTLHGDLCIVGGGDPTLGSDLTPGSPDLDSLFGMWVDSVKSRGIRKISGAVLGDDFAFDRIPIPDDWFWIDLGNYYATSTSALTIHDNLYRLFFHPGKRAGERAALLRMEPEIPGLKFVNHMRTGRVGSGDNGYIYCAPEQYNAVLRGTVPAGQDEFSIKGSIPDPALFAAQAFTRALRNAGIETSREPGKLDSARSYEHARLVASNLSPPLKDIVTVINKRSFNLYAEQLLKAIGRERLGEGSTDKGIEAVEAFLDSMHIGHEDVQLSDGCGLAHTNGVTTRMLVDLLKAMRTGGHFDAYYGSLSVAGDSTDIGFFKDVGVGTVLQGNLRIKSGVIQGVRSYAGYVRDQAGRLVAFAMIANNYAGRGSAVDAIHQEILLRLAELH